jgi:ubiquitin carboxyl-terminal hydrolase L3
LQLEVEHQAVAADESAATLETVDVNTHFIAFVEKDGHLYEMDGRKSTPINHGETSQATLLNDSMAVMKAFMARDEGEIRFTMLALAANTD